VLSLFDEDKGTIALLREWTDQAPPSSYSSVLDNPPILHATYLLKLYELIELIKKRIDDAK
jgi:hypothetical protein